MIKGIMKCWCCHKEMIWGNDNMVDEEDDESGIVSNFSCECGATADFYHPNEADIRKVIGGEE